MFSNKSNVETLELWYKEIEKLKEKFSCQDNKDIVIASNMKLKDYLSHQHINSYFLGSTQTAVELAKTYANLLSSFSTEAEDLDPKLFVEALIKVMEPLKDPALKNEISTAVRLCLHQKYLQKQKVLRKDRLKQRQDFTVQCFTFIAYGIYIDIIAAMVPVSPVRVPFGAMLAAMLAGFAAQYSAGYQSQEELRQGVIEMGDRLFDNSGLHYCYRTVPVLIENVAQTLARNVNDAQNNSTQKLPQSRRAAQLE